MNSNSVMDHKLTFVLTLALSGTGRDEQDLDRVYLLLATFERFFDQSDLDQFVIITPAQDLARVRRALRGRLSAPHTSVLDEREICPELGRDPSTLAVWPNPNKGWVRQQLIKLAISRYVSTPFYMTLDSDVLFVRDFCADSLIAKGRAVLNMQTKKDYDALYREAVVARSISIRRSRYRAVERILKCTRHPKYLDRWYGETPVLLNAELVRNLALHIQEKYELPWRDALLENLPWTEYALYFSFIEQQGALEDKYLPGGANTLLRLTDSLWQPEDDYITPRNLENWEVASVFARNDEGIAIVIQSYLGYPVDEIARKIAPFL